MPKLYTHLDIWIPYGFNRIPTRIANRIPIVYAQLIGYTLGIQPDTQMVKDTRKQVVIKLQNDEYEKLLAAAEARGTSLYKFCLDSMRRDLLGIQPDTQPTSQPASPPAIDPEALASLVDTRVSELMAQQAAPPAAPAPDVAALVETVAALAAKVEALEKPDGAIAA